MGLWVRAHATVKNMGSMGDSDAEKGGLLSLTYASPPEWDSPPGNKLFVEFLSGFFSWWGLGGSPIRQKFCQSPIRHLSPFLDQGLSPPAEVRPQKLKI